MGQWKPRVISVSIGPGQTAFTRMAYWLASLATYFVTAITPPFAAA